MKTEKLKPVKVSIKLVANPEWKKRVTVVKKELAKLSKIEAFTFK